ncbi:MAG: RNA polymerase sigma-70 factor [Chloroflexi bacterium]|nr:RNA polymerase sigma-70 factor [Chloroflexota bacterium]
MLGQFDAYRPLLFSIAYRMLGSVMDAEDMVQETFLRWQAAQDEEVISLKAYLITIVTRLCIDRLRSAQVKREAYVGPWLPEPLLAEPAPEAVEALDLSESLSMAFLMLLEHLSPTERAVFLLREVFEYEYGEISAIVGKSEANCRQMVRRAHQHLTSHRPRYSASPEQQQRLLVQFMQAATGGDMAEFVSLLSNDITLWSDGGGKVNVALNPICGADRVARFLLGLVKKLPPDFVPRLVWINGQPGFIGYLAGEPNTALTLDISGDHIQGIHIIVNPEKLRHLPPLPT